MKRGYKPRWEWKYTWRRDIHKIRHIRKGDMKRRGERAHKEEKTSTVKRQIRRVKKRNKWRGVTHKERTQK